MWHDLVLVHRREAPEFPAAWSQRYAYWRTCLREIALIPAAEIGSWVEADFASYDLLQSEAALRFLVEICAGLHSPIVGETEVFGQFRSSFLPFRHEDAFYEKQVQGFVQLVVEYTKKIREQCLAKGTSSSYGSLCRRFTKGFRALSLFGAGQLAQEILPWLEGLSVEVHARSPEKARLSCPKAAQILGVQEAPNGEAVVIAAPISGEAVLAWLALAPTRPKLLLDMRGESEPLPASAAEKIVTLAEFFRSLEGNEAKRASLLAETHILLDKLLRQQKESAVCRPFGWEDVCA